MENKNKRTKLWRRGMFLICHEKSLDPTGTIGSVSEPFGPHSECVCKYKDQYSIDLY